MIPMDLRNKSIQWPLVVICGQVVDPAAAACSSFQQGRLKVRHKAAGAAMLVPVSSGLLSSLGPAFCQC